MAWGARPDQRAIFTCLSRHSEHWGTLLSTAHVVDGQYAELVLGVGTEIGGGSVTARLQQSPVKCSRLKYLLALYCNSEDC